MRHAVQPARQGGTLTATDDVTIARCCPLCSRLQPLHQRRREAPGLGQGLLWRLEESAGVGSGGVAWKKDSYPPAQRRALFMPCAPACSAPRRARQARPRLSAGRRKPPPPTPFPASAPRRAHACRCPSLQAGQGKLDEVRCRQAIDEIRTAKEQAVARLHAELSKDLAPVMTSIARCAGAAEQCKWRMRSGGAVAVVLAAVLPARHASVAHSLACMWGRKELLQRPPGRPALPPERSCCPLPFIHRPG